MLNVLMLECKTSFLKFEKVISLPKKNLKAAITDLYLDKQKFAYVFKHLKKVFYEK